MIILIDSNHLAYYNSFRNKGFSHNGQPTNVIFGFLKSILALSKKFDSKRFVFAWDSKKSLRRIELPTYKQSHEKTKKEEAEMQSIFEQMFALRTKVLPEFGFRNIFIKPGYEADDVIAAICQDNLDEDIAIVSSDNDLFQLLSRKHFMYDIAKKKRYTCNDFMAEWWIQPHQWESVKSLAGCRGDDVPGVQGVGNKTAAKYLKGELSEESKVYQRILQGMEDGIVETARSLVKLPFPGLTLRNLRTEGFDLKGFYEICDAYGFRSFAAQEMIWREQFDMGTKNERGSKKY